jgi:hypothetical protein
VQLVSQVLLVLFHILCSMAASSCPPVISGNWNLLN